MKKENITCSMCDTEFYVETEDDILFCVTCGDSIQQGEWNEYRDSEYEYEED